MPSSHRFPPPSIRLVLLSGVLFTTPGCYLTPDFGPPGTIARQRARAVVHDPFPNNDIAPPIESGRPLGYDRPPAEAASNQASYRNRGARVPAYPGF